MSHTDHTFPAVAWDTGDLRFRLLRETDVADLAAMCRDPEAQRFLPDLPRDYTDDDAREFLRGPARNAWYEGRTQWGIADRHTDRLLGSIGVPRVTWAFESAEIGYMVAPWARGKGVAAQASGAVAEYLFRHGIVRAELHIRVDNLASQRAALRAGFTREARLRQGFRDSGDGTRIDRIVYTRLPADPVGPVPKALPDVGPHELWTPQFHLRPLCASDTDDHFRQLSRPDVWRYQVPARPQPYEQVKRLCEVEAANDWLRGDTALMSIRDSENGAYAGYIGLHRALGAPGETMLSYGLAPAYRGRGFATRAVTMATRWLWEHTDTARVFAGTAIDNHASQAVLRRAGFTSEGTLRGQIPGPNDIRADVINWAMLRDET